MNVDVGLLQFDGVDSEFGGARLDQREGGLRAFLHHITQLACEDQLAAAGNAGRLDEQDIAPRGGPGETGGHARHASAHGYFRLKTFWSQDSMKVRHCYDDSCRV